MRPSDFIMLTEEEKKFAVLHQGVLVAKRKHSRFMLFLFQLENFYVETICNTVSKSIDEYRVFEDTDRLSPYLESIRIDDVIG